jgi:hypothetical protein
MYMPGFSRQELRAVESCPETLKPLVEIGVEKGAAGILMPGLNCTSGFLLVQ